MTNIFAPIVSPLAGGLEKPFGFFAARLRPSQSVMAPCLMGFTVTCLLLSGCAGTKPLAYSGIASAPQCAPTPDPIGFPIPAPRRSTGKTIVAS